MIWMLSLPLLQAAGLEDKSDPTFSVEEGQSVDGSTRFFARVTGNDRAEDWQLSLSRESEPAADSGSQDSGMPATEIPMSLETHCLRLDSAGSECWLLGSPDVQLDSEGSYALRLEERGSERALLGGITVISQPPPKPGSPPELTVLSAYEVLEDTGLDCAGFSNRTVSLRLTPQWAEGGSAGLLWIYEVSKTGGDLLTPLRIVAAPPDGTSVETLLNFDLDEDMEQACVVAVQDNSSGERSAPSEVLCFGDYFQESSDPEDDSGGAGLDSADPQEEEPAEEDDTEEESGTEDEPLVKEEPRCSCAAGAGPVGAGWGVLSLIWLLRRRGARHE